MSAADFKTDVHHVDNTADDDFTKAAEAGVAVVDMDEGFDPAVVKRITRKIDMRVIPILSLMYAMTLVDRGIISLAKAANNSRMNAEIGMNVGERYNIVTLMFFIPYLIFELPSQIGLRKFGARIWLSAAVILWGIVLLASGFVKDWKTMVALRALLGFFESALFPGAAYLVACWYPRKQMASRNAFFFCSSEVMSGFSGIISWAISNLNNKGGMAGWTWIFLLYGIVTIVVGGLGLVLVTDFPDRAKFLTEEERHIVLTRIERDRGDAQPDPLTLAKCGKYACEFKLWLFFYFITCGTMGGYSLAYFQPTILSTMGFDNKNSQILTTPPMIYMMVQAVILSYIGDRKKWRSQVIMISGASLLVGTLVYTKLPTGQKGARYFGLFLANAGAYGNIPLSIGWAQTSIRGQSRRAFVAALSVAAGGVGGIIATVAFKSTEAKQGFPTGVWLTVAMNIVLIIACALLHIWMKVQNKKADRGEKVIEGDENFRYLQ